MSVQSEVRNEVDVIERRPSESGFSLVEVVAALTMAVFLVLSVQSTLIASVHSRQSAELDTLRQDQAWRYLQRLRAIPFGNGTLGAATPAQLSELLDDDGDLGTVTFRQVSEASGTDGLAFTTDILGRETRWQIAVSNDLDGDGATTGLREGRQDLFRIEIVANGVRLFTTMRAADLANTIPD
jgi:type II secretory pathway pseudopilin PulG